jgi:hypothetical protein
MGASPMVAGVQPCRPKQDGEPPPEGPEHDHHAETNKGKSLTATTASTAIEGPMAAEPTEVAAATSPSKSGSAVCSMVAGAIVVRITR